MKGNYKNGEKDGEFSVEEEGEKKRTERWREGKRIY